MVDYLTLVGTAVNKQPEQLLGIAKRTAKSHLLPRIPIDIDERYERRIPEQAPKTAPIRENTARLQEATYSNREEYRNRAVATAGGSLTFLNDTVSFDHGAEVSLDAQPILDRSLHWRLKCWGFEHLKWSWLGYQEPENLPKGHISVHREWLEDWMGSHPIAAEPGYLRRTWMPHSASLRVLNWSRYDATFETVLDCASRDLIHRLVCKNAAFLSDNVEYGVGGNHLIENAIALVTAGVYADEPDWRRQGRRILERAAQDQFFDDGGHVERSPMYHLIVCQRFLTATDLLRAVGEQSDIISQCAAAAVNFLMDLRPPDDRIPLLNDSGFRDALGIADYLAYARAVGLELETPGDNRNTGGALSASGYYWVGSGADRILIAAHDVAVRHLPGHAHAHPGQICLWLDGTRVLTDTGVFEYAGGQRRHRARSVRSHNTVQIDDSEPVRMASSFWLWGNVEPDVTWTKDREVKISYSVSGFGRPTYTHRRRVEVQPDGWTVTDDVECDTGPVTSRFHVHPDLDATIGKDRVKITDACSDHVLTAEPFGHELLSVETAPYFPEFGVSLDRDVITLQRDGQGRFGCLFVTT